MTENNYSKISVRFRQELIDKCLEILPKLKKLPNGFPHIKTDTELIEYYSYLKGLYEIERENTKSQQKECICMRIYKYIKYYL